MDDTKKIMELFEKSGKAAFLEMLENEEFVNEVLLLVSPQKRQKARLLIENRAAQFLEEIRYKFENSENEKASKNDFKKYLILAGIATAILILAMVYIFFIQQ